jgi:RHS repeat-associated protein
MTSPDSEHGAVSVSFSYQGFSKTVTDADGKDKTTRRDYLGRIFQVTEEGNLHTYYEYNAAGDLLEVEDDAGNITEIHYDTLGLKKDMDDPDMGYWTYTYDANGNLETQTDAKGQVKTFQYDELNRLIEEDYIGEYPTVYEYDQGLNGIGRLYKVTKENVPPQIDTWTRYDEYDAMGRVKEVTKWINGAGEYTTEYNYDLSGKTKKIIYPDEYEVDYAYYPGTNLLHTATGSDSEVYAEISGYTPTGRIGALEHGNGATTTYSYDPKSTRLTGITTMDATPGLIQNKAYQYTPAGDIDSIVDYHNDSIFDYSYDNLHRLIEERTNSVISATYTYNNIGNITSKSVGSDEFNYTWYHAGHKHAVETINLNGTPYDYTCDANGNMTSGPDFTDTSQVGTRSITYNADNMPAQVTGVRGGITTTVKYRYDGFGRRYKKEVIGGMTTYYIGDHFEVKGETQVKYIFAGNLRVAQVEGSTLTYLHKDHLGSSTVITDSSGFETESTQYMPYGSIRPGSGEITGTSYNFTDQEFDTENGLYNYDARLYDPIIGRFISPDTMVPRLFNPQSLNRYSYCLNNPLIYVDPSGHDEEIMLPDIIVHAWSGAEWANFFYWYGDWSAGRDYWGNMWFYIATAMIGYYSSPEQPVIPENVEFKDDKAKNITESLLNDSKEGRKLLEEIATYEGKVIVQTTTGKDPSHCDPPDENGVVKITLNLDRPGINYQYIESDLAHEFSHARDFLSGDYDIKIKNIELDARFRANFHGWDIDQKNEYIQRQMFEQFEQPAIDLGVDVDKELIEQRGLPGVD